MKSYEPIHVGDPGSLESFEKFFGVVSVIVG